MRSLRGSKLALILVFPSAIVMTMIYVYPFIYNIYLSLHRVILTNPGRPFIGSGNYIEVLSTPDFLYSLRITLIWTLFSVIFQALMGISAALLLERRQRGSPVLRTFLLVPWVLPTVVAASLWKWLYNAEYGIINYVITAVGVSNQKIGWLSSEKLVLGSVIVANVWKGFPFWLLMIGAALKGIDRQLYEAAFIDGASYFQILRYVTFPLLQLIIAITSVLSFIWTFNFFTLIYILTEGGPGILTTTMPLYIFFKAFNFFNFGHAATLSIVLFAGMSLFVLLYMKFFVSEE